MRKGENFYLEYTHKSKNRGRYNKNSYTKKVRENQYFSRTLYMEILQFNTLSCHIHHINVAFAISPLSMRISCAVMDLFVAHTK